MLVLPILITYLRSYIINLRIPKATFPPGLPAGTGVPPGVRLPLSEAAAVARGVTGGVVKGGAGVTMGTATGGGGGMGLLPTPRKA